MTQGETAEMARGAQSTDFDPLWSQMTDAEREQAWRDYEKAFGVAAEKESK